MDELVATHAAVHHGVYVDNIGQFGAGSTMGVRAIIIPAACALVDVAHSLKLTISAKSVIVASQPAIARALSVALKAKGVYMTIESVARDLGGAIHKP